VGVGVGVAAVVLAEGGIHAFVVLGWWLLRVLFDGVEFAGE
jgi:hypothetical protein